jgi:hypothetical protein
MNAIERVGIAERERQMRDAVRVQVHDPVDAFRHLAVAFAQLRPDLAARAEDGEGANEGERLPRTRCIELQLALLLEPEQEKSRRRIRHAGGGEVWQEPRPGRRPILCDAIGNRRCWRRRGRMTRRPATRRCHDDGECKDEDSRPATCRSMSP